jgi:hypothetical protein
MASRNSPGLAHSYADELRRLRENGPSREHSGGYDSPNFPHRGYDSPSFPHPSQMPDKARGETLGNPYAQHGRSPSASRLAAHQPGYPPLTPRDNVDPEESPWYQVGDIALRRAHEATDLRRAHQSKEPVHPWVRQQPYDEPPPMWKNGNDPLPPATMEHMQQWNWNESHAR